MISKSLLLSSCTMIWRSTSSASHSSFHLLQRRAIPRPRWAFSSRTYATKSEADTKIEEITELYSTARDEFEIAAEETEKKSIYAADDRAAAQEELQKLRTTFENTIKSSAPEVAAEIKARVGQRIRELENAVRAMEEMAMEDP